MADNLWSLILIGGPLLLLGVMLWAWSSNRKATHRNAATGGVDEGQVSTTTAVRGSASARPDLEADEARARQGQAVEDRPGA